MDGQDNGRAGTGRRGRQDCGTRSRVVTGLLAAALVAGIGASGADAAAPAAWQDVVVTGPGGASGAARAVDQVGGDVVAPLPIVQGVAARLPLGASLPARWSVTPQRTMTTAATADGGSGPTQTVRQTLGLPSDSSEGAGITVAVMDTGVADVQDLTGRIQDRVDITGGGAGDGHGHGTFMAGLIAGSGEASGGAYRGVAPEADIVDVKVADEHGSTDLITVLRGLQWIDDHRRDIQVLNLSLSSGSPLPYQLDPLTQALDALWRKGVLVVVPAGNTGPSVGSLTSPGNDPTLLTVAGLDEAGTADRADDSIAGWSGRGRDALAQPDLAAPGASVVGLLAPGSAIGAAYPGARVGESYVRGSGTSMSTAVTSGIVAAVLSRRPALRPDAVAELLRSAAYATAGLAAASAAGAGGLDAAQALADVKSYRPAASRLERDASVLAADAQWWKALDEAVRSGDGAAATKAWKQLSVESRSWASRSWADLDLTSRSWASRAWASGSWTSRAWAGAEGTDEQWVSRAWASRSWAGEDWASRSWAGAEWESRAWAADRWSSRSWAWLPPLR